MSTQGRTHRGRTAGRAGRIAGLLAVSTALALVGSPSARAQVGVVNNSGAASANTGNNACIGNSSSNDLGGPQIVQGGLIGLGLTLGGPVNYSDGACDVTTGNASATGNISNTGVFQSSGGGPFSFPFGGQMAAVNNQGTGNANTGNNACVGNASSNSLGGQQVTQGGLVGLGLSLGGPVNYSSGSCSITTGNAAATGNTSATGVHQARSGLGSGAGQVSTVSNTGSANANTGNNACIGNASSNSLAGQQVTQGGLIGLGLTLGGPVNYSDGSCRITTGNAAATGNVSQTGISQSGSGIPSLPFGRSQVAAVSNSGTASANTGNNACIGNASSNNLGGQQITQGGLIGLGLTLGGPVNYSDGSCQITTGSASAAGNTSSTMIWQSSTWRHGVPWTGPAFFFGPFQVAAVSNSGSANANTGDNEAIGNASTNTAGGQQLTSGPVAVGIGAGGPSNFSTGDASLGTGNASATGNVSETWTFQQSGSPQSGSWQQSGSFQHSGIFPSF